MVRNLSELNPILVLLFIMIESYPCSVIYHGNPILVLLFIMTQSYSGSIIYHERILSWFCYLSGPKPFMVLLFIRTSYPGSIIYHGNSILVCYLS